MCKLGSTNNTLRQPFVATTRVSTRPCSRPLLPPSALNITSPSLPSRLGHPQRIQERRLPICESSGYSVQGYSNPSPGRRQLSDVIDDFINLPWQKIASWVTVALLATQLQDFLGVCLHICFFEFYLFFCICFSIYLFDCAFLALGRA
jgi:hypothetical protein